jgi:DNA-binding HxlR family transcriptional regulator
VTWYTLSSMKDLDPIARVEWTMGLIGAKWKPAIIYALVMDGTLRFSELKRRIPGVTQRMLTQQLRDLERHGLVRRLFLRRNSPASGIFGDRSRSDFASHIQSRLRLGR